MQCLALVCWTKVTIAKHFPEFLCNMEVCAQQNHPLGSELCSIRKVICHIKITSFSWILTQFTRMLEKNEMLTVQQSNDKHAAQRQWTRLYLEAEQVREYAARSFFIAFHECWLWWPRCSLETPTELTIRAAQLVLLYPWPNTHRDNSDSLKIPYLDPCFQRASLCVMKQRHQHCRDTVRLQVKPTTDD